MENFPKYLNYHPSLSAGFAFQSEAVGAAMAATCGRVDLLTVNFMVYIARCIVDLVNVY